ncbi:hypothetical protein [Candidatus Williamhamiltonella defendens]|uniref:hypothetical protein n=1 Tax=Candidatus Williamhamiltonella defendens TaxID=138072 RepID=UPI001651A87F|nr:hypothetical protein [Candidatus Hamiltonella defensa]
MWGWVWSTGQRWRRLKAAGQLRPGTLLIAPNSQEVGRLRHYLHRQDALGCAPLTGC